MQYMVYGKNPNYMVPSPPHRKYYFFMMKCTDELLLFSNELCLLFPTELLLCHIVLSVSGFQGWDVRWQMTLNVAVFHPGQRTLTVHSHVLWDSPGFQSWSAMFHLPLEQLCSVLQGSWLAVWFILSTRKPSKVTVKNTVLAVWHWSSYSLLLTLRAHLCLRTFS